MEPLGKQFLEGVFLRNILRMVQAFLCAFYTGAKAALQEQKQLIEQMYARSQRCEFQGGILGKEKGEVRWLK